MNASEKYYDTEGHEISLYQLIRKEPSWAENVIKLLKKELAARDEHITRLTEGNSEKIKHAETMKERETAERCAEIAATKWSDNYNWAWPSKEISDDIKKEFGL